MKAARIMFIIASVMTILGGTAHFFGQFASGHDGAESLVSAMRSFKMGNGPRAFSFWDVMQSWGIGMGTDLIWIGVLSLLLAGYLSERPGMLRLAAIINGLGTLAFVAMAFLYGIIAPGLIMCLPMAAFFLAAIFSRTR
jgi:hypothetical protein